MLSYPNWTKPFIIHMDASNKHIGAVISQEGKPIAFFSRKFNTAQRNYTTTEKELLAIIECLKQFRNILFGYEIIVYSDHKNLVRAATISKSQRVMHWQLLLEEFAPNIHHISGEENVVADTISCLSLNQENRIWIFRRGLWILYPKSSTRRRTGLPFRSDTSARTSTRRTKGK